MITNEDIEGVLELISFGKTVKRACKIQKVKRHDFYKYMTREQRRELDEMKALRISRHWACVNYGFKIEYVT